LPTPAEIERQIQLEREAIACGLKKLHKTTLDVEKKDYASASIYGVVCIDRLLPDVVAYCESTKHRIIKGHTGAAFAEVHKYLDELESLAIAAIALKITFDKVFSLKDKSNQCQNVLLHVIKKNTLHSSSGTQQRLSSTRHEMNKKGVKPWSRWSSDVRLRLGAWILDAICEKSGWFERLKVRKGRKTFEYLVPTAAFSDVKDEIMTSAELFSPLAWPMLVPPKDWKHDEPGGYLLNEVMNGHDLVRRGDPTLIQGEIPLDFLNKIQKVAYRVNPFIVEVARWCEEKGIAIGKFKPIEDFEDPPKPVNIDEDEEARRRYKRDARDVHNKRSQETKKSCRTRMTMNAVARFEDEEKFYIPWSFDYRGRAYPIPAFLTPQDTDFGKSLLKFASGSFMTPEAEEWLAFQVATTYGLDKEPIGKRLEWVEKNTHLITCVASNPIDHIHEWEEADEPWQFLAACEEYYHCVLRCDRQETSLPVATDATCSGLQILAGLARDRSTAKLVNVLPSDRPQDAYKVVANTATPYVPKSIKPYMDRKTVKRVVMTVPYNAKPFSNRGYIKDALKEKGVEIDKDDLTKTVIAVRNAMDEVVPGPMAVMSWIESEVANAIERGSGELEWVTPSGFVVRQRLMKKDVKRIELQLLGSCKLGVVVGEDTDDDGKPKVDKQHHKNATAPNLIHSLDASLLHISALRFEAPIALIHDSVLCRATDMSTLSNIVRETYMHLFAEHDYLRDFAHQIGAETEPPIIGDLEPESVIESTYFFC
jgi:DNA-directed RNA polymerase